MQVNDARIKKHVQIMLLAHLEGESRYCDEVEWNNVTRE